MTTPDTTRGDNLPPLPERYALIKGLGAGGMSQVFLATDTLLLKNVAIKVLHSSADSDPKQLVRFQREAKITGQLKHRNIVGINDFGMTSSGQAYIVMDHIVGESLADILDRIGAIALADAMPVMLEILDAVECAHAHGVLHRDLKPSNIIISHKEDEFDVVKLIDFGIAKLADPDQSLTGSGGVFGSPAYMSPEQARGKHIDARSEVYSLGCLFFSILAGQPPFEADTAFGVLNLHCNQQPPLLRDIQPETEFSDELQSLISKCLEKDPENRVQSVTELSHQLRLLDDAEQQQVVEEAEEGATARSVFRLAERSDKRTRKSAIRKANVVLAALASVVIIAIVATSAVSLIMSQSRIKDPVQPTTWKEVLDFKKDFKVDKKFRLEKESELETTLVSTIPLMTTDEDLKEIGDLKYTKLKLRDFQIDGSGLKYIHNPNLVHLDVSNVLLSKEGWQEISKLKTLTDIDLEGVVLHNSDVQYLIPLSNLHSINFTVSPEFDREGYAMLTKIPNLQLVTIMGASQIPNGAIAELVKKESIRAIAFTSCAVTPEDIRPIRSKTNSFSLTFDNIDLNQKPLLDEISKLTLWQLGINSTKFKPESLMALKRLKTENITIVECSDEITKGDRDAYRKLISPRKVNFHIMSSKHPKIDDNG